MRLLLSTFILLYSTFSIAQVKTYVLTEEAENADINYELFKTFNNIEVARDEMKRAFEAVDGDFTTYTFISEFSGPSFDGTEKIFHDYLILKVDPTTNEIIDGFQYTLEWAEPPAISDLYQLTSSGQILIDHMSLNVLKLKLVDSPYKHERNEDLEDNGQLLLN